MQSSHAAKLRDKVAIVTAATAGIGLGIAIRLGQEGAKINVRSPIMLTREVVPHLRPGSSIVYISSYTAFNPTPPIPMYAVSKTALLGLTKALAEELGPKGIRVNCIAPGVIPTKFSAALVESKEKEEGVKNATFLKRLGRPEDIAAAAAFLSSDDASYITAETLLVAGGMQSRL
ncbi:hypothetical protein WJX84_004787 [Apatococcus fuscideae]|uniref:Uncharacterized protein n=1 Tax=Apatococcus fuscideae TaxID=2026836 RepID=A0AAW1T3J7_9CHLO